MRGSLGTSEKGQGDLQYREEGAWNGVGNCAWVTHGLSFQEKPEAVKGCKEKIGETPSCVILFSFLRQTSQIGFKLTL